MKLSRIVHAIRKNWIWILGFLVLIGTSFSFGYKIPQVDDDLSSYRDSLSNDGVLYRDLRDKYIYYHIYTAAADILSGQKIQLSQTPIDITRIIGTRRFQKYPGLKIPYYQEWPDPNKLNGRDSAMVDLDTMYRSNLIRSFYYLTDTPEDRSIDDYDTVANQDLYLLLDSISKIWFSEMIENVEEIRVFQFQIKALTGKKRNYQKWSSVLQVIGMVFLSLNELVKRRTEQSLPKPVTKRYKTSLIKVKRIT